MLSFRIARKAAVFPCHMLLSILFVLTYFIAVSEAKSQDWQQTPIKDPVENAQVFNGHSLVEQPVA